MALRLTFAAAVSGGRGHSWKPVTLGVPVLLSSIVFALLMVIFLQTLLTKSSAAGGFFFVNDIGTAPTAMYFAYTYLPTLLSVLFGIFWGWIDLDAKRLEPFFQLCRPGGAKASDSLLLHYPIDFLALVPFKAAKRRQWSVLLSGTIVVLATWVVTPLLSGVFTSSTITQSVNIEMIRHQETSSTKAKDDSLNAEFMNSAYSIIWLGQEMPPFTTPQLALAPFEPRETNTAEAGKNITWTAPSVAYTTELSCTEANVSRTSTSSISMSNNRGCNVTDLSFEFNSRYVAQYIPWYDDPFLDYSLDRPSCTHIFANNFLAIFSKQPDVVHHQYVIDPSDTGSALFCEPKYYYQKVNATVNVPSLSVDSTIPTAPKELLPQDFMNVTLFEYVIGTGLLPGVSSGDGSRREWPQQTMLSPYFKIISLNVSWPISNMVGFGLGIGNMEAANFLNATVLHSSFEAAHQLLFALAVSGLPRDRIVPLGLGQKQYRIDSVHVSIPFTVVVQTGLGLIAAMTILLIIYNHRRPSKMRNDPSSIADIIALIPQDPRYLRQLASSEDSNMSSLEKDLAASHFEIQSFKDCGSLRAKVVAKGSEPSRPKVDASNERHSVLSSAPSPIKLSYPIGCGFIAVLFGLLLALGLLHQSIRSHNGMHTLTYVENRGADPLQGLPSPSRNDAIQQLILSYIPTAIATLIEPFWVLLARMLCILQPFEHLRQRGGTRGSSLNARYASLPPQLAIWRAFRRGDLMLTMLCAMTILANMLTIALSGLLSEAFVDSYRPAQFEQPFVPKLLNISQLLEKGTPWNSEDVFYINKVNITRGTSLPPWVTDSHFYLPFRPNAFSNATDGTRFQAVTDGFSVVANCSPIDVSSPNSTFSISFQDGVTTVNSSKTLVTSERVGQCRVWDDNANKGTSRPFPFGKVALEYVMRPPSSVPINSSSTISCNNLMFAFWLRAVSSEHQGDVRSQAPANATLSSLEHLAMSCSPVIKMSRSNVMVDGAGNVLQATDVEDQDEISSTIDPFAMTAIGQLLGIMEDLGNPTGILHAWHNDTFASDWPNYLLKVLTNSSAVTDPDRPLPEFQERADQMQQLLQRLFAVMLSLYDHPFYPAPSGTQVHGFQIQGEWRVFMSEPMFYVATVILSLNIVVASAFYIRRPRAILPRMPTSLGSIMAYCAPSSLVQEVDDLSLLPRKDREASLDRPGHFYGFGRFRGKDGEKHLGIERWPRIEQPHSKPSTIRDLLRFTSKISPRSTG